MNTLEIDQRPIVTDAPTFKWSANDNVRLLYRVPAGGFNDWVEVIGDPSGGGYEWVYRDDAGKIAKHSDCGYGSTMIAMRDGLAAVENAPSVGETRDMENILRKIVQADDRDGLSDRLRRKIEAQGGECDDADAWLVNALDEARKMVMKRNRDCGY
jgi:hypothetical protein